MAGMLGYGSAQEVVSTITDSAHQVWLDQNERSQFLQMLEQNEAVRGFECQWKRKDGRVIWVSLSSRKVCGKDGRALYVEGFIEDITERKRAEDALRKSEEKFAKAFRGSPTAKLLAKIESEGNRIVDANEAFQRLTGYRREEVIGRIAREFRLFADPREYDEWMKQFRGAGRVSNFEFHFRRKDGEIGTGLISAESLELDGEPWMITTTIDITERRQSERQYRSLFNSMQEGVALHKLIYSNGVPENYILLDVNRRYEELLGMKREHVVNRLATDVYGTEAAPHLKEYASVVEGGMPFQFETYFPPLDKHFVISVTPMGEDLFATIFFDDTEQRRAQERYRLISENAADVIWMWDLEEGRCVYVSPSVRQLRGFSPEEILAQTLEQAMPSDSYGMAVAEIESRRAAVESGDESARIKTNEVVYLRKDGTTVATETVTKLVSDARGKVRYVVGISRDITQLKRVEAAKAKIEDELRQAQKLESVGRLAAGVAHDFNNLLTVINGYSRLLLGGVQAGDPLRGGLEEIHKAGARAAALIQQLLAFSRKQILQPRVLDLNRVVEEMRPMLARLMGEDVEVCVQLHTEPTTICADPHQLEQVLMNLAVNSRDAMPDGGQFSIETGFVEWDESQAQLRPGAHAGPYVMLAVSDTGEGMSEETRGHIFEPFFTTKEVGKGTGLGLSTIHGIVEQSGGCVEVASEPGRGTTFKIYLPRVVAAPAESGRPEAIPEMGGTETVLVVEDQAEVREYAAVALRAYGYQVMEAANAEEALLICEREGERIDLILTDVVMPGLSGRELADRLKTLRPGVKVLFMSGHTDDIMVHHGVLRKEAEFIHKPFGPGQLAMKVREILMAPDRPARIVVADDEAGVRSFLRLVLESAGYQVMEAPNGKLALQEARAGRVDLVITDLVMPEQEGIETIRALRRDVPGVGIIAISGALGPQFLEVARMLGAQAVLSKPLSAELLLVKVAEVLKSRR
jgi:PAS domain S-box-containing protein